MPQPIRRPVGRLTPIIDGNVFAFVNPVLKRGLRSVEALFQTLGGLFVLEKRIQIRIQTRFLLPSLLQLSCESVFEVLFCVLRLQNASECTRSHLALRRN